MSASSTAGIDGLGRPDRRRLRRLWTAVTLPVLLVYVWVLTGHTWDLLRTQFFDDFFDEQARSLLDGRWDVPPEVVGIEGFVVDGRTYIYFGPLPALLRLPILAVTERFDGRLTVLSMLVAYLVVAATSFRLTTAVRGFVRGETPVTRRELVATGVLAVAVLTGAPFWLASQATVHHEAALWGVATAIAAFDACARWMLDPRPRRLALASGWIAAAMLTRQTLGLGALVALVVVIAVKAAPRLRELAPVAAVSTSTTGARTGWAWGRRRGWGVAAAVAVPLVLSTIPNVARFNRVFGVPVESQVFTFANTGRQQFLDDNDGSFFGLQFLPTTVVQYLRPDAFDIRPDLPWIDFPRTRPKVIGGATFDDLTWSSSVTTTMPLLVVLAVVGAVVVVRALRRRRPEAWLGALCLGALVGAGGVLTIGHVAHRYLNDMFPMVLIPALVGFYALEPRLGGWRRRWRLLGSGAAVAAATFGLLATTAMALQFRHERGANVSESERAEWVRARASAPLSSPKHVEVPDGARLPRQAYDGLLGVVGDCDGLYIRVEKRWWGVERGPGVGVYDIRVDLDALDDLDVGRRAPLITLGSGYPAIVVAVTRAGGDEVRVDVWNGAGIGWRTGPPHELDGEVTIRVAADPNAPPGVVTHGRDVLYGRYITIPRSATYRLGAAPSIPGVEPRYPGGLDLDPVGTSICDAVVGG